MQKKKYKIKLQPGDYCRRDMGEEKYREVAQRFFDDGCPEYEKIGAYPGCYFFGWQEGGGLYHTSHDDMFNGRLPTYDEVMALAEPEPQVDWHERGELPPVGVECEYIDNHARNYKKCKIDFIGARLVVINTESGGEKAIAINKVKFRPLKSYRDKAIEAASTIFINQRSDELSVCLGALYDAGLLRLPEDK